MRSYKTTEIKFEGVLYGKIWMPATEAYMPVEKTFTSDDRPFTRKRLDSLDAMLAEIENSGDFQSCTFHGYVTVIRRSGSLSHSRCFVAGDEGRYLDSIQIVG